MTKFDDFLNQPKPDEQDPNVILVDAGLACGTCFELNDDAAEWNPVKKTLHWHCPKGHPNVIKDFKGF